MNAKTEAGRKIWDLKKYGGNAAAIDVHGKPLTYLELDGFARELAATVGERCHVFVLCDNVIGSLAGYVSFVNQGIVPFMLSAGMDGGMLSHLIGLYRPPYVWAPEWMTGQLALGKAVLNRYGYSLIKNMGGKTTALHDALALLLATSGSTGSPKFVRQSYENIRANTESIVEYLGLDSSERPITTLPMNYTYGLSIVNTHLYVGATVLLTKDRVMHREFWDFFKGQGATSFGGVPYTYEVLDKLRFYRMDLPSLRTMTQAGGKLTPELHERFARHAEEKGRSFVVMYGQCEATARMGYLPAGKAVEKKGSMGIAIPGGKFRLIDVDGKEIRVPHTTGELVYEGANVTLGYAECPEDLSKGDARNGMLATGDMAKFDEDGYYYIVGRKKRFLKIYGNRVNLDEIDRMIKGEYGVEVASAGIDDHMYIFLADGALAGNIRKFISEKTGLNLAAFEMKIIDEIPKNESGKIQYSELGKYY